MPRVSLRREVLELLDATAITIALRRNEEISMALDSSDTELTDDWTDTSSDLSSRSSPSMSSIQLSPLSPSSSVFSLRSMSIDSNSSNTISTTELIAAQYNQMLTTIQALCEDVEAVRVLEHPEEPMLKASQLPLLTHYAEHQPKKFCKKLRVYPVVFNDILGEISDHPIFQNWSNNRQIPISIQLAIFLYCAGHYRNACSPDDIAEWAGVSIGTVMNSTHRIMVALLDQHDNFVYIPGIHSEDM